MLFRRPAKIELHDEVIFELGLADDIHFSFRLRKDSEVGLVVLGVVFGQQLLKIFDDGFWVLPELNVELLDFFDSPKVHIVAPELEIKLELAVAGELDTDESQILRVTLNGNFN